MKEVRQMGNINTDILLMKGNITNPTPNILMFGKKHSEEKYMRTKQTKLLGNILSRQDIKENLKTKTGNLNSM
jgi:hypothetical protein